MSNLRRYTDVFHEETLDKKLILHFASQIDTRTFSSGLSQSMMVPMAENYNHANVVCKPYLIHTPSHTQADSSSKYFSPTKFMNDYSKVIPHSDLP